jgi:hypothetical protein
MIQPTVSNKSGYFFFVMSCTFPIVTIIGFRPSYLAMNAGEFPIHWLAHVHGAIMSSWLLIYMIQGLLAARNKMQYHKQLGLASVGIGILALISMIAVSARALIGYHPELESFLFDVLLVQIYGLTTFGIFFIWGIRARKNPDHHKRLMYLATVVLLQAAIDRIPALRPIMSPFIWLDLFLIPLFAYDLFKAKRIHKISIIGLIVYVVMQITVHYTWGSPAWHRFWYGLLHL